MSVRAPARLSLSVVVVLAVAVAVAVPVVGCQGQLRLDDDAGTFGVPAEGGLQEGSMTALDAARSSAGCTKDVDCVLGTLHCDVLSGACVPCVSDEQCSGPVNHRCDAALHRCVECGVDGDCGAGRVCVPSARQCATSCHQLTDCVLSGFFCDLGRSICARCTGDEICKTADPETPVCSPVGRCVLCVNDSTCPAATPRCDRTTGSCVQCLGASDCGAAAPLCNPATSSCVSR